MATMPEQRRQSGYWAEYLPLLDEPIVEGLQATNILALSQR
jgi:hypothetical protein